MKITWKTLASLLFYILGVLGWGYVGGWLILTKPLKNLMLAHAAGSLTVITLFVALVQGFIYLSLAGGIWCIGYMLSNYFKEEKE